MDKCMKGNRKVELLIFSLAACVGIGGTWAYFTGMQGLKNTFSIGTNTTSVIEEFEPPRELKTGDNIYKKKVQVENTGTVPCFVRVFVDFSDSGIRELSQFSPDGLKYYPISEYIHYLPDGWNYISESEDERLGGFYYYEKAVGAGEKTAPLFEKVKTSFDTADQVVDYEIIVYSESERCSLKLESHSMTGIRTASVYLWMPMIVNRMPLFF